MDISKQKADLRKLAAERRRAAHAAARTGAEAARDHFLSARLHEGAQIVSGYWAIRTELDPEPLMRALHEKGIRLCLPVIMGQDQPLRFREWVPDAPMEQGPYGAEVPASGDWLQPDLVIVPLLSFDPRGQRLGYGGGFYDRTLAELSEARNVRSIGLAYSAQEVPVVPVEPTDRPLDAIVTEEGVVLPDRAKL